MNVFRSPKGQKRVCDKKERHVERYQWGMVYGILLKLNSRQVLYSAQIVAVLPQLYNK